MPRMWILKISLFFLPAQIKKLQLLKNKLFVADYLRKGAPYPPSGYDELDTTLMPPRGQEHYRITPSPGGPASQYGNLDLIFFKLINNGLKIF
jgi:hypothetical protein